MGSVLIGGYSSDELCPQRVTEWRIAFSETEQSQATERLWQQLEGNVELRRALFCLCVCF